MRAVAARWWCARGRRALVVCARSPRAGGRQLTEPSGERARSTLASVLCATLKSLSQPRKTEPVILSPRLNPRTQTLRRALLKERRRRRRPEARKRWQTAKSHKLITDYGHYELKVGVRVSRDGCRPTRWHHARTCRPPPRCNVRSAAASSQEEMLPRRLVHALAAVLRMQRR